MRLKTKGLQLGFIHGDSYTERIVD
jgi:hypothetical protein